MSKHTPGPWTVDERKDRGVVTSVIVASATSIVAEIRVAQFHNEREVLLADAQLIAAAPEMLAALESLLENYSREDGLSEWAVKKAELAIAKARGES